MRLRTWVRREGHGAIRKLADRTGLAYQSVLAIVHGRVLEPKRSTAKLLSAATGGAVSVDEVYYDAPRKRAA